MRMYKILLVVFLLGLAVSGQSLAVDDSVKSFEKFLDGAAESTNAATRVFLNGSKGWTKQRYLVSDVKFDVRKTDSLVTPVVGIATFQLLIEFNGFHPSREQAETVSIDDNRMAIRSLVTMHFTYSDDKWRFVKGGQKIIQPNVGELELGIREPGLSEHPFRNWIPR